MDDWSKPTLCPIAKVTPSTGGEIREPGWGGGNILTHHSDRYDHFRTNEHFPYPAFNYLAVVVTNTKPSLPLHSMLYT